MKARKRKFLVLFVAVTALLLFLAVSVAADNIVDVEVVVPRQSVAKNGTFDVQVNFKDPADLVENVLAGIQVEIQYDKTKFAISEEDITVNAALKAASNSVCNVNVTSTGKIIFVAVKENFSDYDGYADLTEIFSAKFTALTAVADVYETMEISSETSRVVAGSGSAIRLSGSIAKAYIAKTIEDVVPSDLSYVKATTINSVEVGPVIKDIALNTTASALKAKFADAEVKVTKNGTEIAADAKVGTGMTVELWSGNTKIDEAKIVISGDTNGDGAINANDHARLKAHLQGFNSFEDNVYLLASDTLVDGLVNANDHARLKAHLQGFNPLP